MFVPCRASMLANMSEIEDRAASDGLVPSLDWSDAGMNESLPTGTVTLLLADVQGSTQLWNSRPEEMTAAIANLDRTLAELVSAQPADVWTRTGVRAGGPVSAADLLREAVHAGVHRLRSVNEE